LRYAGLIKNDFTDGQGVCVSLYMQGCPLHCPGCHNSQAWDPRGGIEIDINELGKLIKQAISANGIQRNFSVLGGEPLAPYNLENTAKIIRYIRFIYPNIKIFLWTGYTLEKLNKDNEYIKSILDDIDILIDGPYIENQRDITLFLRGSSNQRVLEKGKDF
jgi:anaerobic ribonucleoside-triphosphate reductase activating protein